MILKKLEVKEMFGIFNYSLDLSKDITIITAPNGYGKTICLKTIHSIFSLNFMYFASLDFKEISLITDMGDLTIRRNTSEENSVQSKNLNLFDEDYSLNDDDDEVNFEIFDKQKIIENNLIEITLCNDEYRNSCVIDLKEHQSIYRESIEEFFPFLRRMEHDRWVDRRTRGRTIYNLKEVLENFDFPVIEVSKLELPDWLKDFAKKQKTYFVQDQRLILKDASIGGRENFHTNAIERYSAKLKSKINSSSLRVSIKSQELDSTFPQRLVNNREQYNDFDKSNLINQLDHIQDKRKKLMKYDILSQGNSFDNEIEITHIEDNDVKVLNLYVEDTNEKLSTFDDIYEKINTFVEILNSKLIFKKVKIDSKRGFYFVRDINDSKSKNNEERLLSLSKLSSGEQHQVIILYQLIFNSDSDTLVLIDEPEISLHIVWQKQFMSDLVKISAINNSKSIIATHSPQIIGNQWESTIDLEDLRKKQVQNL
ncbi:AAA family ATPase [Psychrobacter sp. 72-O-c]|uniref:AAA family ATPase n=1 Tax=Psychrobacter sp. 72-O-c TaxID=2774125 RepID=UPI001917AF8B|nr:AAA family ATPase [Psychrobacter sp. 72-O-c]